VSIIVCWCVGAMYALMGAVSVSELAAMYPQTGGFRIYASHAFGDRAGFVVGWSDWLASVATLAFAAVSAADFLSAAWPALRLFEGDVAIVVVVTFGIMHAMGVRMGSSITSIASAAIGMLFIALVIGCLLTKPVMQPTGVAQVTGTAGTAWSIAALLAIVPAMQAILTAYDGWYAPIYTAEECVDAPRMLLRAIIGGALMVAGLYLAINVALLRVLPVPVLAASKLPAADAAQAVLPQGSAALMTALSLLIVLGLANVQVIIAPQAAGAVRVGRDLSVQWVITSKLRRYQSVLAFPSKLDG